MTASYADWLAAHEGHGTITSQPVYIVYGKPLPKPAVQFFCPCGADYLAFADEAEKEQYMAGDPRRPQHITIPKRPGIRCGCDDCRALGPIEGYAEVPGLRVWSDAELREWMQLPRKDQ